MYKDWVKIIRETKESGYELEDKCILTPTNYILQDPSKRLALRPAFLFHPPDGKDSLPIYLVDLYFEKLKGGEHLVMDKEVYMGNLVLV